MNTLAKPGLKISAKFLGPVLSLDGDLASKPRNLIFARNGTGKSFLSRALRCLDRHGQSKAIADAPRDLVSDESSDGKGLFSIKRGESVLGSLQLDKKGGTVDASIGEVIFHVFSEDFVHEELREQQYRINGDIENEIAIDSSNIKLKDAQAELSKAQSTEFETHLTISVEFDRAKEKELVGNAGIKKTLKEYANLSLQAVIEKFPKQPDALVRSTKIICNDLAALKSIPPQPIYPEEVTLSPLLSFEIEHFAELQKRVTSPSTVSEAIKQKIAEHPLFFKTGIDIIKQGQEDSCPFCKQSLSDPQPKSLVEAYLKYFSDEEEKHKEELRSACDLLDRVAESLDATEKRLLLQKSHYTDLNDLFPSRKNEQLEDPEHALKVVRDAVTSLKGSLRTKIENLSAPGKAPDASLLSQITSLRELVIKNNLLSVELAQAVHNSDSERKRLQREACDTFASEFANGSWGEIEALRTARAAVQACQDKLAEIERASPSTKAKARVAETFDLLLKEFFATKYILNKDSFTLKRGDKEMSKGIHRTLSDGEKSAIAFCYFVASIHIKVKSNADYRKLFLVFDDPVTSMSYDYVFAIAQTLRNLALSDEGAVSLTADRGGNKFFGPELLILTHSTYFFNISVSNRVVDTSASFALHPDATTHQLATLNRYIAPFNEYLRDIWQISSGTRAPDHSTGNAIRSILEAVGRFCRPDKSNDLSAFIQHLTGDCGFTVKSVLINSMSHGTYYDEIPSPDDLKLACSEAIAVVGKFAAGQIELLKAA